MRLHFCSDQSWCGRAWLGQRPHYKVERIEMFFFSGKFNLIINIIYLGTLLGASLPLERESFSPWSPPSSGLQSNIIIKYQAGRAFTEMRSNFTSQNFSIWENPRWGRAAAAPAVKISHGFALYNRFFPCMEDNPNRTFLCMKANYPYALKNQRKVRNALVG